MNIKNAKNSTGKHSTSAHPQVSWTLFDSHSSCRNHFNNLSTNSVHKWLYVRVPCSSSSHWLCLPLQSGLDSAHWNDNQYLLCKTMKVQLALNLYYHSSFWFIFHWINDKNVNCRSNLHHTKNHKVQLLTQPFVVDLPSFFQCLVCITKSGINIPV